MSHNPNAPYAPNLPSAGGYPPPQHNSSGFAPPPGMGFQPNVMPQPHSHPQEKSSYEPPPYPNTTPYPAAQPDPYQQPHPYQQPAPYPQPAYPQPPQPAHGYQPVPSGPIITQPGAIGDPNGWMTIPLGIPSCPPGLEYLTTIDQLLVKQKVELLEAFTGFETNNKFTIKNSLGQKVYWAVEENDCCTRNCCGPARPFDMKIMDIHKNQVMHLNRPLACSSCFFPCCLQSMEISAPPGNVIGRVEQEWSICFPSFAIKNHNDETVLRIEGPLCTFSICGDVEFKVVTMNGNEVGKISKKWSGLVREMFTDADFFGINFPLDLDVRMKATLLGACFLIDAMFFEKAGNQEQDRTGMF